MKTLIIVQLLFFACNVFGQTLRTTDIEVYTRKVDELKAEKKLEEKFYPDMSACGGGLYGYYHDQKLVLIDATYRAELGFSSRTIYLKDTSFVKIVYREHFAEWGKYDQKYPSDKYKWDPKKMTYTDTLYTISLSSPIGFTKRAGGKVISRQVNQELIDQLIRCGKEMRRELAEVESGVSWAQSDRAESLLSQLMNEVKRETKNYSQVIVDKSIPWDTSEYVFKTFLSRFDTTDLTNISNKSTPTRRRIVSFSRQVTNEDYQAFREQVINQRFTSPVKLKGNRKSKHKMTVSFSQPLITVNGKMAIVKDVRSVPGQHHSSTMVYVWNEGKWTLLRYLYGEVSFSCPP